MAEVRLTKEGVEKYEKRLEYLKTTGRTEIAEQIKIARSFGDLSETRSTTRPRSSRPVWSTK